MRTGIITALEETQGRYKRIKVHINGRPAFSLEKDVVLLEGLRIGQKIDESRLEALKLANERQRCMNAAYRFLSYRPRSEKELRDRLLKRNFAEEYISEAISKLKESGMIDDAAFARFWRENRESFRPRSRRLTKLELRRKGVASEVINQAVEDMNEDESAYRAAEKKAKQLSIADYQLFYRRLGGFLQRRGFGYETTRKTVERLWREGHGAPLEELEN